MAAINKPMSRLRRVRDYLSAKPISIEPNDTLATARDLMHSEGIRHLPVLMDNKIVGIITWSDVEVIESILAADPDKMEVGEVMTKDVATIAPNATLGAAARLMAELKVGSLMVVTDAGLAGIFTATDAVRALGEIEP